MQNKNINSQKEVTTYIYDAIMQKVPIEQIEQNISTHISKEIKAILQKLKQIGYLNVEPLKTSPTVSVIIPHFNHQAYLDEALFHLLTQTQLPDEIIIVDDSSKHPELVHKIAEKYNSKLNIKIIMPNKKLFSGGCRQLGAELATSNIIMMHDADDISHQNRIELTKYFFKTYQDAIHLNACCVRFKDNFFSYIKEFTTDDLDQKAIPTKQIAQSMKKMFTDQNFSILTQSPVRWGSYGYHETFSWGCNSGHVAYRQELVNKITWTTPNDYVFTKYEDYEFNFLLLLLGQQSYQVNLPLIYYRMGTSTIILEELYKD